MEPIAEKLLASTHSWTGARANDVAEQDVEEEKGLLHTLDLRKDARRTKVSSTSLAVACGILLVTIICQNVFLFAFSSRFEDRLPAYSKSTIELHVVFCAANLGPS
jgi:hypothetical protein